MAKMKLSNENGRQQAGAPHSEKAVALCPVMPKYQKQTAGIRVALRGFDFWSRQRHGKPKVQKACRLLSVSTRL